MLIQDRLRHLLSYNPVTGEFHWVSKRRKILPGAKAGTVGNHGAVVIRVDDKLYLAHRLAWLYTYGTWPSMSVTHVNGDKTDNAIHNLREISIIEKANSTHKHKSGKLTGVSYNKRARKWVAYTRIGTSRHHIGCYNSELDAHAARINFNKANNLD
jgi:hypothetical protein